jgi:prepilin-type N-terminal cleavage/methylation domain-containing protein
MRNYINNLKANSKKGFSLVELIIVIAIMAILVGIVASQVIPYMEKSRKGKDQQQISSITTAVVSAIADHSKKIDVIEGSSISSWGDGTAPTAVSTTFKLNDTEFVVNLSSLLSSDGDPADLKDLMVATEGKFKSKAYTDCKMADAAEIKCEKKTTSDPVITFVSKDKTAAADVADVKLKAEAE